MTIGFIGLGIMGEPMARNIIQKSMETVWLYDIDKGKVKQLENEGGRGAESAAELARNSDVIITMLPNSNHVTEVYNEILTVLDSSKLCVDMSTISPDISVALAEKVRARGGEMLDAPVVKSKPAAIKGELGILVGGDRDSFERVKHILFYMGRNVIYLGEYGKGLIMKIAHNALVAQIQNGVNETLSFAVKNGISPEDFVTSVSYGGGQNFYLDSKNRTIQEGNYQTAFSVENMHKDLGIIKDVAEKQSIHLNGVDLVKSVYDAAIDHGYGKEDFSATYKLFAGGDFLEP